MTTTTKASERDILKIALAALAGSSIENYDFFIYGTAAALVFPQLFFPEQTPLLGALLSFATFSVGFLARPLGAVLFGHLGDRRGRKTALVTALVTMGVGSTLIGLLPTYATAGVLAPMLLVLLRFVQGVALGGQHGGVVLLAMESAPHRKRGFYSSFAQAGGPSGIILGNLAFLLIVRIVSPAAFESWGWRVPFLVSVTLVVLSVYIQLRLPETRAFRRLQEAHTVAPAAREEEPQKVRSRSPILATVLAYPRQIALVAATYVGINVTYYIYMTFVIAYATNPDALAMSKNTILFAVLVGAAVQLFMLPVAGALSDRFGRKPMMLLGAALLGVWSFAFWPLLSTESPAVMTLALILALGVFHTIMYGPQGAFFAETFRTSMRYSGVSLGVQLGALCGGAWAPLIATSLYAAFQSWVPIACYLVVVCAITFVGVLLLRETHLTDIDETAGGRAVPAPATGAKGAADA